MNRFRFSFIFLFNLSWLAFFSLQACAQVNDLLSNSLSLPLQPAAPAAPDPFGKLSPANNAVNQPVTNLVLQWNTSSAGVTYQYCVRPNKTDCPAPQWVSVGSNTSATLTNLNPNSTYYWQVRAVDASATT
jgi:hypothetical protein